MFGKYEAFLFIKVICYGKAKDNGRIDQGYG